MSTSAPKEYRGERITVTFDSARCLHAAECVRGAPAVFDTGRRPWITPDGADAELVAEVIRRCPSGALHYTVGPGSALPEGPGLPLGPALHLGPALPEEEPERPTVISARPGEPLWVRGDLVLRTADGTEHRETRAALCGCGATANAPFCDHSGECGRR